jgi:ribosomal protein S18 acetylase RimI-like enzyme
MMTIRSLTLADEPFLWEILYHAIYVPPDSPPLPRSIIEQPEMIRYVNGWGQAHDDGFIALDLDRPVGAAWLRLLVGTQRGFGYIDDSTPEISMAVLPEYRGQGIGSQLFNHLLKSAASQFQAVCLSVDASNPALHLYERFGFEVAGKSGTSITMIKKWS